VFESLADLFDLVLCAFVRKFQVATTKGKGIGCWGIHEK